MTQDFALISRQLRREVEQGELKRQRLQETTQKAEDNHYASSTKYGQQMLKGATASIAAHMSETLKSIGRGKGCVDAASVYKHLKAADTEIMAVLALKVCLDVLAQTNSPNLVNLTEKIGSAIEIEMKIAWYLTQDKDLFKRIERNFHGSTGTAQKHTVFRLRFNEAGLKWDSWGSSVHHKVGNWALRSIMEVTGWVEKSMYFYKPGKSKTVMRFTHEFIGLRDSIMQRAMELAYCLWPMLCPPNNWSDDERGGYLTEDIRGTAPMIRKVSFGPTPKQGNVPIEFLNRLQRQEYRLNRSILEVAEHCYERRRSVGKFIHESPRQRMDSFIGDPEVEQERFKEWKREQRRIDDFNAQLYQKNYRATETMFVARMYKDEARFWIPWSFDYRGRVYPQNTSLNPQGTDFDKSLLYFTKEGPVDEHWLAWHCATTYGNDKVSHNDRAQWARDNSALISQIAQDPCGTISLWEQASEPWCFLAAAVEYHECVIASTRQTSGLPIGIDATCSGLQHLASMTRDAIAAKQVNVIRGDQDKPSDGYKAVAEQACNHLPEELHEWMTRKVTKRVVMTTPYGVSRDSARDYVKAALHDAGFDLSIRGRLGAITDAIYRKAMPEVFEGPVNVMKWLQATAMDLLEDQESIEWVTPSGFHVSQDIRKPRTKRIDTMLMGSVVRCQVGDGFAGPDRSGHKGAIAPNLVHSLDASLLHLMFYQWDKPFTVIHDCILGRSCDMDEMMQDIRLHHAEIYKGKPLEDWADQLGVSLPPDLVKDTLDLDDVLDSPYFFC